MEMNLVDVVLCRDCQYALIMPFHGENTLVCNRFSVMKLVLPDDYCSWGESIESLIEVEEFIDEVMSNETD